MNLNLDITPEDINREVSQAILNSTIGKAMTESINRLVSRLTSSYDNPIDDVLLELVKQELRKLILTDFAEMLRKAVQVRITNAVVDSAVEKAFRNIL